MRKTRYLEDCISDAKDSLIDSLDGRENYLRRHGADNIVMDTIHECADSGVPTYTADIIDVFRYGSDLWYAKPDSGFEGCESVTAAMSMLIYEAITEELYGYANELEGGKLVCEENDCDEDDDHDVPADDNPRCTMHCGGLETCEECQEVADAGAGAHDADLRAKDEIRQEEADE